MIVFQNPNAFYGLILLIIPIIIHLFNFRKYQKLYFTNLSILQESKSNTSSINKLKKIILLISRLLILICLILAFANPVNKKNIKNKTNQYKTISIIIDNNLLLENTINNISSIELLKQKVIENINNSNQNKFNIITNNIIKKQLSKGDAIQFISRIKTVYNHLDTSVIKKNESELNYIYSNFKNKDLAEYIYNVDTNKTFELIDFNTTQYENLKIYNVTLKEKYIELNKNHQLNFSIYNEGEKPRITDATLYLNKDIKQVVSVNIPAKSKIDTFFNIYPIKKINEGNISIEDSPIYYDNDFYFNFIAKKQFKALLITDLKKTSSIEIFLSNYNQTQLKKIKENDLRNENLLIYDIIILNELNNIQKQTLNIIKQALENEKTIVIIPSKNIEKNSLNKLAKQYNLPYFSDFMEKDTITIFPNLTTDFYTQTFNSDINKNNQLPSLSYYYKSTRNGSNTSLLADKENGKFTFLEENNNIGKLFLFYFPFESNGDWTYHPLFTVTLMRIFETSKGNNINFTNLNTITKIQEKNIELKNIYKIKTNNNEIVLSKKYFENKSYLSTPYKQLTEGNFTLITNDSLIRYVSLNYPRINNSAFKLDLSKIKTKKQINFKDFNITTNVTSNTQWYKVLILLALLFIIFEILIIRFYK